MKKLSLLAISAAMLLGALSAQAMEFAGNVAITTDYRFRGISQGDRSPAIQGGFDLEHESGLYIGTWASNVTFSGAAIEMDYYGGYSGSFNENVSYDIAVLWYNYPEDDSDPDLDYVEFAGSVSALGGTLGVYFSPDYFAETGDFFYFYGDYGIAVAENFSIDLHLGYNLFDSDEEFAAFGLGDGSGDNYIDYSVGVSTSAAGLDFSLAWIGTDLKDSECFGGSNLCDDTVVFSVSKSL